MPLVKFPEHDEIVFKWFLQLQARGFRLSGKHIQVQAEKFAIMLKIPEEKHPVFSNGWLDCFKLWCGIRDFKFFGKAGSVSKEAVATVLM